MFMNSSTKELAMYFDKVVNSRLDFLDDALCFGSLGDEAMEMHKFVGDYHNTRSQTVGDLNNNGFGYKTAQNNMVISSRSLQSNLSHHFYQPIAQNMSRHCGHMIYQTQMNMQPLDYSNNYRNNIINVPATVNYNYKPDHFNFELLRRQSFTFSPNTYNTPQIQVDYLQQCVTNSNNGIISIYSIENRNADGIKSENKNSAHCSDAYNEIDKTCRSEENQNCCLENVQAQSEMVKVEHDTDLPPVEMPCSINEVENDRIGRQIVNEILESVEQTLYTSVENIKCNMKETNLELQIERKINDKDLAADAALLNSSPKPSPSGFSKGKIKLFSCPECTWVFSSKPALVKHVDKKHKIKKIRKMKSEKKVNIGKSSFQCNKCMCCFSERSELKVHSLIHLKERRLRCNVCGLSFKRSKDLDHHSLLHNKKPVCCEICGKTFTQAGNMKIHLRIHTKEKPYTCQHCGKSYAQSGDLKTHIRVHTDDRPYLCEYCGNLFLSLSHLARHSKVHTKEKPYTCQVCGHSFAHTHHLKKHYRIHTQEKPYSCEICGKAFSRADYVKQHIRVHTKEKPYICRICGKGFSQGGSLKLHQRVHNNTR